MTKTKRKRKKESPPAAVEIDLDDFERRGRGAAPEAGYFSDLAALNGKLIYRRLPRAGSGEETSALVYYDLESERINDSRQRGRGDSRSQG